MSKPAPRITSTTRKSLPSIREIGNTMANELGELIDRLGEDHPNLLRHILRYIKQLDELHPTWAPVLERARDSHRRRLETHHLRNR